MSELTLENFSELSRLLEQGNRGEFYWRYYQMTGEYQALIQAQITTYSGIWGGLAVTGNYFAKLMDQANYRLTLDRFSYDIVVGTLLAISDDLDDVGGDGLLTEEQMLASDAGVWIENQLGHLFPGLASMGSPSLWANFLGEVAIFALNGYQNIFVDELFNPFSSEFKPWEMGKRLDEFDPENYDIVGAEDGERFVRVYVKGTDELVFIADKQVTEVTWIDDALIALLADYEDHSKEALQPGSAAYEARQALWDYTQSNQEQSHTTVFIENQIPPNVFFNNQLDNGEQLTSVISYHQQLLNILLPLDSGVGMGIFEREAFIRNFSNSEHQGVEGFITSLERLFSISEAGAIESNESYNVRAEALFTYLNDNSVLGIEFRILSGSEIFAIASQDTDEGRSYRYSLVNALPFAIVGDVSGTAMENSAYDLANFSASYLEDRTVYLQLLLERNQNNSGHSTFFSLFDVATNTFIDRENEASFIVEQSLSGRPNRFYAYNNATDEEQRFIVFDNALGSEVRGNINDDRIYGGGGNDTLIGGQGNDCLDGGLGNDSYYFSYGDGHDTIFDVQGDNTIYLQHTSGQTDYANLNGIQLHEVSPFSDIYVQLNSETGLPANNTRYIFNGSALMISIDGGDGGRIVIENFNPQSNTFGLTFNDYIAPTPPDQTNTEILSGTEIDDYLDLTVAYESSGQLWGQVYGGEGHDYINGTEQSDEIYGGAGDDLVWGNLSAADQLFGGEGNDWLFDSSPGTYAYGEAGNDLLSANSVLNFSVNSGLESHLAWRALRSSLQPGFTTYVTQEDGVNFYHFAAWAGFAAGTYTGSAEGEYADMEYRLEVESSSADPAQGFRLGSGVDSVTDSIQILRYDSLSGEYIEQQSYIGWDEIFINTDAGWTEEQAAETTGVTFDGGEGDDLLVGWYTKDTLIGGAGDDFLTGRQGHDLLDGGEGADILAGGLGNDTLLGGDGNDVLLDEEGNNFLYGGAGDDRLSIFNSDANAENYLDGGEGDDTIIGGSGKDTLMGGDGVDTLAGWAGDDEMHGGDGNDLFFGGEGNDTIYGGNGNDELQGQQGNDFIYGEAGTDLLAGGEGDDLLSGGTDNDGLLGGEGSDTLIGGAGADYLEGGAGNDTYVFYSGDGEAVDGKVDTLVDAQGTNSLVFGGAGISSILFNGAYVSIQYGGDDRLVLDNNSFAAISEYRINGQSIAAQDYLQQLNTAGNLIVLDDQGNYSGGGTGGNGGGNNSNVNIVDSTELENRIVVAGGGSFNVADMNLSDNLIVVSLPGDGPFSWDVFDVETGTFLNIWQNGDGTVEYLEGGGTFSGGGGGPNLEGPGQGGDGVGGGSGSGDGSGGGSGDGSGSGGNSGGAGGGAGGTATFGSNGAFLLVPRDPLVLDLDGDGIELTSLTESSAYFDLNGDGFATHTSWLSGDDGFLTLDRNTDGEINDISELFGSPERTGYEELSDLDSNGDGVIDASDDYFADLMVWRDVNGDGSSQTNELQTLSDAGLASISLTYQEVPAQGDADGQVAREGTFNWQDGTQGMAAETSGIAADVLFSSSTTFTRYVGDVMLDPDVLAVSNIKGYGQMPDLHIAMSLDTDLKSDVLGLFNSPTVESLLTNFESLLVKWADVQDIAIGEIDPDHQLNVDIETGQVNFRLAGESFTLEQLGIIKQYAGMDVLRLRDGQWREDGEIVSTGGYYRQAYNELSRNLLVKFAVAGGLLSEIMPDLTYNPVTDMLTISEEINAQLFDEALGSIAAAPDNIGAVTQHWLALTALLEINPSLQGELTTSIGNYLSSSEEIDSLLSAFENPVFQFLDIGSHIGTSGVDTIYGSSADDVIIGFAGNDHLVGRDGDDILVGGDGIDRLDGYSGNDILIGGNGNDTLVGYDGDDLLKGGEGSDSLYGGNDNDVLNGGADNDKLYGDAGNDTYLFGRGDDRDTIYNDNPADNANPDSHDRLLFKDDLTLEHVEYYRSGSSLVFRIKDTQDTVTVSKWFESSGGHKLQSVEFADGRSLDLAQVEIDVRTIMGGSGSDTLNGAETDDLMYGGASYDTLRGYDGDDLLDGGTGNDTLIGGDGNDLLIGVEGSDSLYGGNDNDVLDGGADNDKLYGDAGNDTYLFGRGDDRDTIYNDNPADNANPDSHDRLLFKDDLTLEHVEYYRSGSSLVFRIKDTQDTVTVSEWFESSGGHKLQSVEFADGRSLDLEQVEIDVRTIIGGSSSDTLSGADTDDLMYGGASYDTLRGYGGDDLLDGGTGNDTLIGGDGNDLLIGDEGSDSLYGGNDNDVLNGGADNDKLYGDSGNDTYLFGRGDNRDTIYNDNAADNANPDSHDRLLFKDDVTLEDVEYYRSGSSLVFRIKDTQDTVTVSKWFESSGEHKLQSVEFADGRSLDLAQVEIDVRTIIGGSGHDRLDGAETNDTLYGLGGNDTLLGGEGDDILNGGLGNDYLSGGAGNDTYLFGAGDGADTVTNHDTNAASVDIAHFEDVSVEDLWFSRSGNNLKITVAGTNDRVTVNNWYSDANYQLDRIEVGASVLLNSQVEQLVSAMASYGVPSGAGNVIPQEVKDELQPILAETWQAA